MAYLKVVGIVTSPKKGMNTDALVTKMLEGARSIGAQTEKIYLNDLEIKPCKHAPNIQPQNSASIKMEWKQYTTPSKLLTL